jgi:hypothetical protein
MIVKILPINSRTWVQYDASALLYVKTCKRCKESFDTPDKQRIYCGDKCQFATWNDTKTLNVTDPGTVKTRNTH